MFRKRTKKTLMTPATAERCQAVGFVQKRWAYMNVQIYGLLWRKKWREAQGVACYACYFCVRSFQTHLAQFVKGWWTTPQWRSDCNWVATVSNDFIACSLTSKNRHSQTKTTSCRMGADLQRSRRKPNPYKIYQILVSLCFPWSNIMIGRLHVIWMWDDLSDIFLGQGASCPKRAVVLAVAKRMWANSRMFASKRSFLQSCVGEPHPKSISVCVCVVDIFFLQADLSTPPMLVCGYVYMCFLRAIVNCILLVYST